MSSFLTSPGEHLFYYWRKVLETYESGQPHLRYGQTAFNVLYEVRPELANMIVGTNKDPFYSTKRSQHSDEGDDKWKTFVVFLNENFYEGQKNDA